MATEVLKPNSIVSNANWTGNVSNIDENIATPDGSVMQTFADPNSLRLGFTNVTSITNIDIVNSITIKVRALVTDSIASNDTLTVNLYVSAGDQGSDSNVLTGTYQNLSFTNVNWNSDWTVTELNSIELVVSVSQATRNFFVANVDVINIEIDYTPVPPIEKFPGEEALSLAGAAPVPDYQENFKWAFPSAHTAALTGKISEITRTNKIPTGTGGIALQGKVSYVSPVTATLLPNAASFRPGWTGFVTNIDEPIENPDGSVITYTRASGTTTSGELVTISFTDAPAVITDQSDVHKTFVQIRLRAQPVSAWTGSFQASVFLGLRVGGVAKGTVSLLLTDQTSFTNQTVSFPTNWDKDWSVNEINSMQLTVEFAFASASNLGTPVDVTLYIDAVNLDITHTPQSPLLIVPPAGGMQFSTAAATFKYDRFLSTGSETLVFAGQAPAAGQSYRVYTDPDNLQLSGKSGGILVIHYSKPGEETLSITPRQPQAIVTNLAQPGADTLALAGKTPVSDRVDNHWMQPNADLLRLVREAPAADTTTNAARQLGRVRRTITGQAPTADRSENRWITAGVGNLSLTPKLPFSVESDKPETIAGSAVLAGKAPQAVQNDIEQPGAATALSISGHIPVLGPREADLALTGKTPLAGQGISVGRDTLALSGQQPSADVNDVRRIINGRETLVISGAAPTLKFTSQFSRASDSRFISLTVDYRIEHIGTPAQDIT